ncbi:hypothetical protein ACFLWU_02755 [Chloroflexota bacterium]
MNWRKVIGWIIVIFSLLVMFVGGGLLKLIFEMSLWVAFVIGFVIMWGGLRLTKGKTLF